MTTGTLQKSPLDQLKIYARRQFIPPSARLTEADEIAAYYKQLISRPIQSLKELKQWLLDRSELETALDQVGSVLYIKMTCQTDDKEKASNYTRFIEHVVPVIKPLDDELNRIYLKKVKALKFKDKKFSLYTKAIETDAALFVKENVPLQTKVDLLSQEYQTICGAMMVQFEGQERTLPEMGKYLLEIDRNVRERAWRATAERRLKDKDKLENIFDQMLKLRHQIALNAKCKNFRDYKFKSLHRFDYTPQDCKAYHQSAEEVILPLWAKILERRKGQMKLKAFRPWDMAVDPLDRLPLKPFAKADELIGGCSKIFKAVDPLFGKQFQEMIDLHLLDLESRKGKAPGGYQSCLSEARKPFIFMNAVGLESDVRTLLHEGGHAFHSFACCDQPMASYRHGPMEFNEVASMAMELLGGEYLEHFYSKADVKRSKEEHLEDIVYVLIWVATIDCFQHWIYEHPTHSQAERRQAWINIRKRFDQGLVDWSGLDEEHAYLWHRQLHVFEVPFYYIEYGIAQLGTLQLFRNANIDWKKAVGDYRKGLALGGSETLPKIYKTAGIKFDFSAKTIKPLMKMVADRLELKV